MGAKDDQVHLLSLALVSIDPLHIPRVPLGQLSVKAGGD